MPYKKQFYKTIEFKKSLIVGFVMLFLDFIAHNSIGNPETWGYFLAKPIIASYIAYFYYKNKSKLYFWASTIFAFLHGAYYRVIELFTGNPLFSRVGDVTIGTITFKASTIWQGILIWWVIHGCSFFVGLLAADFAERRRWLKR